MKNALILVSMLAGLVGQAAAATPPALVNYQGVLRDASDAPLTGTYEMVFHFWNASTGGDEILVDSHTIVGPSPVVVSGGLFNVQLGSGEITDGAGPGSYASLADVFRDYGSVYLSVQVGGETLTPRTRIVSAAYAENAANLEGKGADSFIDTSLNTQTKAGALNVGVLSSTVVGALGASGAFQNNTTGSIALLSYGYEGVEARGAGPGAGGFFYAGSASGNARLGYGDWGVYASGHIPGAGGYFYDTINSGKAYLGQGDDGVVGFGARHPGYFQNTASPTSEVALAESGYGVIGFATSFPGYFDTPTHNATGLIADGTTGRGIEGFGDNAGGTFANNGSDAAAYLAYRCTQTSQTGCDEDLGPPNNYGILASVSGQHGIGIYGKGDYVGGQFKASSGIGIVAKGLEGGRFIQSPGANFADVAGATYKITGNGSMGFVQNDPSDADRVIVYNAPEGDEVATYTRGTGIIRNGEAHVVLGRTFAWVTNPDVGLTAYITPFGAWTDLYVASKSTKEIIVRSRDPHVNDVAFDYIVYGLRIGFEETSIVQEKQTESLIPSMKPHRKRYEDHPELRAFNAFQRFKSMRVASGDMAPIDLSASQALHDAIGEYDPSIHGPVEKLLGFGVTPLPKGGDAVTSETDLHLAPTSSGSATRPGGMIEPSTHTLDAHQGVSGETAPLVGADRESRTAQRERPWVRVSEQVEFGDVLVVDRSNPGAMRCGDTAADPNVVGIVSPHESMVGEQPGEIPLAPPGVIVLCKVDAGYGAIHVGDLLTASPTRCHAMKSAHADAGTIVGKAVQDLEAGTGIIRVLVMLR